MWVHGLSVSVPVLVCPACRKSQCGIYVLVFDISVAPIKTSAN